MTGSEHTEEFQEAIRLLRELVTWTKLATRPQVAERYMEILDSDEKKLVYEYSDGQKGVREIEDITGVNKALISMWWRDWDALGIMEQSPIVSGRRRRIISLETLGIEVPPLPKLRKE